MRKKAYGFFLIIAVLFGIMLYINFRFFRGSSGAVIGITQSKDHKITSEKSGVIKKIYVIPGQEVKTGDLLMEMENNALEIETVKLENQINALKKEKEEKASLVQSKIDFLKAESGIRLGELESEIQQTISEQELNKELSKQFGQQKERNHTNRRDPQDIKINSLKKEKELSSEATNIRIRDLLKENKAEMLMLENEIRLKEQELQLLIKQKEQLIKYATFDGVVESVFVRAGEEIQAFSTTISVNPKRPTSAIAYLVGPKSRQFEVGNRVEVHSYNNRNISVSGEVIGFGSIAELPEILQKSTAVNAFGTEVFIKIPAENGFVSGEKVLVK